MTQAPLTPLAGCGARVLHRLERGRLGANLPVPADDSRTNALTCLLGWPRSSLGGNLLKRASPFAREAVDANKCCLFMLMFFDADIEWI